MPWDKLDWTTVGAGALFTLAVMFQGLKGFLLGRDGRGLVPPQSVEVAGALIDNKRVDLLIDALGLNTAALHEYRRAIERNTEQAREVQEEAERLSRDMRELGDRLARSGRN